jgi:hypothetical protein
MPRPLIFAACDNVLIDRDDNSASLISLIEGVTVSIEGEIPEDARLPMRWFVFCLWHKEAGDEGKRFEQNIRIISPSGKVGKENPFPVVMEKSNHRIKLAVQDLPIGEFGEWTLTLSLREADSGEWKQVASYPFNITRGEVSNEQAQPEATEVG